jgi:hypothetical protein
MFLRNVGIHLSDYSLKNPQADNLNTQRRKKTFQNMCQYLLLHVGSLVGSTAHHTHSACNRFQSLKLRRPTESNNMIIEHRIGKHVEWFVRDVIEAQTHLGLDSNIRKGLYSSPVRTL